MSAKAAPAMPAEMAAAAAPEALATGRAALSPLAAEVAAARAISASLGRREATMAVPERAQPAALAALARASGRRPVVVAAVTEAAAERLTADLQSWLGAEAVAALPAWETLPFEQVSPAAAAMGARLRTIWRMGRPETAPSVVVASVRALMQRLAPGSEDFEPVTLRLGDRCDRDDLIERLVASGYRRGVQVEQRGEMAVRGSIVDVFDATSSAPVRIDLWGDEIERLCTFSVSGQRSGASLATAVIFGCRELRPNEEVRRRSAELAVEAPWGRRQWELLAEGAFFDGMEAWLGWLSAEPRSFADLIPPGGLVVLIERDRLWARAQDLLAEEAELARHLAAAWGVAPDEPVPSAHVAAGDLLARCEAPVWCLNSSPASPGEPLVEALGWESPLGGGDGPVRQAASLLAEGYRVVVAADGEGSAQRLRSRLADHGVALDGSGSLSAVGPPGCSVVVSPLRQGCILPEIRLAILAESDLTGRRRVHRRARPAAAPSGRGAVEDLRLGGYVVHRTHGVACYRGMVTKAMDGVERDYLLLEYEGDARLYVPTDQLDTVRQYTGGDAPTLSRLGGADWQRTKSRVRSAVSEVAGELVALYRKRHAATGHAFGPDGPWQAQMEAAFAYPETADQLSAIAQVKEDMEKPVPMDRLICGDVGFGKTEVAVRAAFKAVADGRQAAVLVPTTLLAHQHYQTFAERYAGFPVRVEMLSRFLSPAGVRRVLQGLRSGEVDVVVGTHRLLSGDVAFARLGLLIVDEEQRFGVTHKEAIKTLRCDLDVLTLTATPIPRTLEMSLTGIRDLTVLQTPPADRKPIGTYVGPYDERAVVEAIRRELLRDGQVFFVHNRVADIDLVAARLGELVPDARVAVAHGQMEEAALEQAVLDFWDRRHDVMVCTTIIESGIDMPTVNTLIVDRADQMGLAQLHQIRGRVGRAQMRAYAYLFTPPERSLSEDAYERLKVVAESTELGSGIRIAMRDLEIRGAGNLLGVGQSGHIAAVGYDLYCEMVTEAVAELAGEAPEPPAEVNLDVPVDAHLPSDYVPSESLRFAAYRRLAEAASVEAIQDVRAEWLDRFGPLPAAAESLLAVARLRVLCVAAGVSDVSVRSQPAGAGEARISPLRLRESRRVRLERLWPAAVYEPSSGRLRLPLHSRSAAVEAITEVLERLGERAQPAAQAPSAA
ncbi:MAG: transcription-repair coupling factor [bacterium]|nr:transcription-repair coupling factor [bacterium]